ncbi:Uncharacterized protein BP5553_00587 [Venustampulla echinocandica]|uniref:Uncharacterized protein n=1 Tax=Venustampulla echinocandica TaxID=2656787 RepID=A0A370TYL1_9HELO|nr:Uncharacterized protein BP5553_00587 [Venustampulla echinocandica]RDL40608.1 Uncharacterized protein BP5553_00587 [Venustampulla echinocandica]
MELPSDGLRALCASRLPSYRPADLQRDSSAVEQSLLSLSSLEKTSRSDAAVTSANNIATHVQHQQRQQLSRPSSSPLPSFASLAISPPQSPPSASKSTSRALQPPRRRPSDPPIAVTLPSPLPSQPTSNPPRSRIPASHSRNGLLEEFWQGPPPAMITQGSYKIDPSTSTTDSWVAAQQSITIASPSHNPESPLGPAQPTSARSIDSSGSRPLIKPIRGFKPSSRKSVEMASRRTSIDPDHTLRAFEGYERPRRTTNDSEHDELNSDESDMFLRAARDEGLTKPNNGPLGALSRSDSTRSRIGQRSSLPPSNTSFPSFISRHRGPDQEGSNASRLMDEQGSVSQALTYRPAEKSRASAAGDQFSRSRFYESNSRSTPATPRALVGREISPPYSGRRPSLPDPASALPSRPSPYRQSNLSSYSPRNYNSSPLVSRTTDMLESPAPGTHAPESTESTVSTTAPSTVWDELEDLKSRIHRLELTGKLPATSGAAMSRASNERPPTATTTVTTISTSPKRGRGNSISPTDVGSVVNHSNEAHPLLREALAKSKPVLSPEIFKALEATASDALVIASMMGSAGQPGPISSSQSTVGGVASTVSDRQVRRKADSLCRSLTELCLAMSDGKSEHIQSAPIQNPASPMDRSDEVRSSIEQVPSQRQAISTDLARIKSSPRALSRLEARRSSLLAPRSLPSPRFAPSESGTPTQSSMAGRRTSLLLRSHRAATEERDEDEEIKYRTPSRATTEIGRLRNPQREYVPQESIPERTLTVQSSLPVRRHAASSSLPNTGAAPATAPLPNLAGRRYIERSTPERDTTAPVTRLMDDREKRKSSIGQGFGLGRTSSLTRRTRQL